MKKKVRTLALCMCSIFLNSCSSDDSISDGISIDLNNLSGETLNGTWQTTSFLNGDGSESPIGEAYEIVDNDDCPDKPSQQRTKFEYSFAIYNQTMIFKDHEKRERYFYDSYTSCDISGKELKHHLEMIEYDVYDVEKFIVEDNNIYFEIKERGGEGIYSYSQNRLTIEGNKIIYSFVDYLPQQESANALTKLNYHRYCVMKKVSNEVDLSKYNDGNSAEKFIK